MEERVMAQQPDTGQGHAMKRKRLLLGLAVGLPVVLIAAIFLDPTCVLLGYLRGEAFHRGRPTSWWKKALENPAPVVQAETFQNLKGGGQSAARVLVALLGEKSSSGWKSADVRWKAADLLGQVGPDATDTAPALIEALKDEDLHVRTVAATSLGVLKPLPREAIPNLIALLGSGDRDSVAAARTLSLFGPEARSAIPALVEAMQAKDSEVRWNAIRTLGKIGPEARTAVPALIKALKDEDALVREHAAESLGEIGPDAREAVGPLIETLKDRVARVRRDTARSLGQIGEAARPAIPRLKELLGDPDKQIRQAVTKALRALGADPGKAKP
jgi:HEAT repeat protein